ncbi:MAG: hypothetical protein KAR11_06135 [Phycisphaerae bacterium]|nr:hypothetical protein [Phycisphaerae bacterium]
MHENHQNKREIDKIIADDGRYKIEAFGFLHEGLARAAKDAYGDQKVPSGHVSGQQLCQGIRDLAVERWGMMAPVVLQKWGVNESIDFGNMVYLLIKHGFMRKTDEDSVEDFRNVFNLDKDFDISEKIRLKE